MEIYELKEKGVKLKDKKLDINSKYNKQLKQSKIINYPQNPYSHKIFSCRMFHNTHSNSKDVDTQMGQLMAFIILFEKKIEQLKIKLAGNQQFHSRLAFQLLDKRRKATLSPEDLTDALNRYTSKSLEEVEAFSRKYTVNGSFCYDEFIKFFTPRTNKILAQRLMIRTYRQGTTLPPNVITLLLETFSTAVTMTTIAQNLRKQLHANTQLTHLEILENFRKYCTSREKIFYFINASAKGEGDYDFVPEEMDFLVFHVRGKCQLEDISDQQIKEILCPLDMNYQKHYTKTGFGATINNEKKNRTQYFKTKTFLNKTNENEEPFRKTVNFLRTNYQQTSKIFYQTGSEKPQNIDSKEMFLQPVDQNVQTKPPTPMMMNQRNFPGFSPYLVLDQYNLPSKMQGPALNNPKNFEANDTSQISSINYGNLYIQKFTRVGGQNSMMGEYSKKLNFQNFESRSPRQLENLLFEKFENRKKKEMFYDEFNNRNHKNLDDSDNMSADSAFLQY